MTIMSNNKDLTGKVAIGTPLEAHPTPKLEATTTHQNTQILTKSYLHSHRLQPWHRRLNNSQVRLTGRRCRNKLHFIQGSRRIRRSPSPRIWRSRHNPQSRRIKRDRSTSDVRDPDERFGRLDIVVSNSGIEHFGSLTEVTGADIDAVFAVNVKGQYFVAQQAYKHMADFGRVMLTSSISAVKGVPETCMDFGPRNITVNCIAAGGVKTDMYTEMSAKYIPGGADMSEGEIEAMLSKWSPLGRVGLPEDVSGVAALIASPDSQWLTGQTFQVSGGAYMV
ncbi:hypothetical protein N7509_011899 [Penicillium cosmopolitanum]|uniref:Uncharacterized protein n=1 Tax=Penicillium cosmopolitanum TaxID=1131564 RepID=A0A9W9SIW2_9EURO|nr:uncharacterized protein N7509_011899 [Penicillium cosmopolitanum]KAJ5378780.1 hypothetical protein N7509_011899 [Penicillium cosmopolitanum]